jgi:hypothetical protein
MKSSALNCRKTCVSLRAKPPIPRPLKVSVPGVAYFISLALVGILDLETAGNRVVKSRDVRAHVLVGIRRH